MSVIMTGGVDGEYAERAGRSEISSESNNEHL